MTLRIIGDIHGEFKSYKRITKDCEWSVQLGDFGFRYTGSDLDSIDPYRHRFFGGNHDNYDIYELTPRSLGNYGVACMGGVEFFYIRGAFSIDWQWRQREQLVTGRKLWWEEEQLKQQEMVECLVLYNRIKPKIVITHSCPRSIASMVGDRGPLLHFGYNPNTFTTNTQEFLETCIEEHQPEQWYFGHFHKNWHKKWAGTDFYCINSEEYIDVG